jgi:hypothetical protein
VILNGTAQIPDKRGRAFSGMTVRKDEEFRRKQRGSKERIFYHE